MNSKSRERKIQTPDERRAAADLLRSNVREKYPVVTREYDKTEQKIVSEAAEVEARQKYHEAWQNYYQKYYERYYLTQLEAQRGRYSETEQQRTDRIRNDLLNKISNQARRFKKSKHFRPILIGLAVLIIILFIQYNQILTAGWHNLIAPNSGNDSGIIIADGTTAAVNDSPTIMIPKISVEAPIIFNLPNLEENTAQVNLKNGVIHYPITGASSIPGQNGNTVILGHSSGDVFEDGTYKFVFVGLSRLQAGDLFYIDYNNVRYTYQVDRKEIVAPNNLASLVLGNERPFATLITCDPIGTNINRLLIIGRQISPDPKAASAEGDSGSNIQNITGNSPTLFERLFNN